MAGPPNTPCADYCTAEQVRFCEDGQYSDLSDETLAITIPAASAMLWRASAYRWSGECETDPLLRPCPGQMGSYNAPDWFYAGAASGWAGYDVPWGGEGWWSGDWFGSGCEGTSPLGRRCGCDGGPSEFQIARLPVVSVEEVWLDGVLLVDQVDYRVDDYQWIVRLPDEDGNRRWWPACQDMSADYLDTDAHTLAVKATYGQAPPPDGVLAAMVLAGELGLWICGGSCATDVDTERINREGVQFAVLGVADEFGFDKWPRIAKMWVKNVNPKGIARTASVWSPDAPSLPIRVANTGV